MGSSASSLNSLDRSLGREHSRVSTVDIGENPSLDLPEPHLDESAGRTLADLLNDQPGNRTAVILPETGIRITYDQLRDQVMAMGGALRALGIQREDRVATALPNGLPAIVSFLAASIAGTAVPLNPAYLRDEFSFYLQDTSAKVLLCPPDGGDAARKAAAGKVPVHSIDMDRLGFVRIVAPTQETTEDATAGSSTLLPAPDDVALILHTSGTTGRPKRVPIRHRNILASVRNIVAHYALTPEDVALVVMPLFHVHGLIASALSSLLSGGTIVVLSKFQPATFWNTVRDFGVTWYSAVPTIHQTLLSRVGKERPRGAECLRFIRSCSAPLPPEVMTKMEQVFGVPVLEAYGMTEATHQISSNPLPPGARKPGSVGPATNVRIGIVDSHGIPLPMGERGEVVIQGPGVVDGYENNPAANSTSFIHGWFRTGDQGFLDRDGHLTLTGRIKELINRGGEKIAPREIDEILLIHPRVAEAVTFGVPHPSWGEEVAAAIVLRDGAAGSDQLEMELREFCAARLAHFKVPRRILFIAQTPKGPTGKIVRIGLAEKLGLTAEASAKSAGGAGGGSSSAQNGSPQNGFPQNIVEMLLLHIWEEELGQRPIGIHDDFFDLGGDSLLGARLLARIEETFGRQLGLASFFEVPTVAHMAALLSETPARGYDFAASKVIAMRRSGSLPPLFILGAQPLFRPLILDLPQDLPVYGLTHPDIVSLPTPFRLEDIAAQQVEALQRFQPTGPCAILGWCANGVLAYEIAQQLRSKGREVSMLVMIDGANPARGGYENRLGSLLDRVRFHVANIAKLDAPAALAYGRERLVTLRQKSRRLLLGAMYHFKLLPDRRTDSPSRLADQIQSLAVRRYVPRPYSGTVIVIRPEARPRGRDADAAHGWRELVADLHVLDVPGNHRDVFVEPNVRVMATALGAILRAGGEPRQSGRPTGEPTRDAIPGDGVHTRGAVPRSS